jgi:GTPase
MSCTLKLSKEFARKCSYRPKQGVDKTIYLVNTEDIDKATTVLNTTKTSVTTLTLGTGAKLFKSEGNDKSHAVSSELVVSDFGNGMKHQLKVNVLYYGDAERAALQEIIDGARITAIVKKVDTGESGELSYEVYGFESGMVISEMSRSSSENAGVISFTLASKEGEEESTDAKIFMDTDLATTEAWIESNTYVPD